MADRILYGDCEAVRLPDTEHGELPPGLAEIEDRRVPAYWKSSGIWWMSLPGTGIGSLTKHAVEEHEDGTITVTPSIAQSRARQRPWQVHGFLTHGKWRDV